MEVEEQAMNKDGETIKTRIAKETNLSINPQNCLLYTALLENGVDIDTIKSLMGHTNVKTTQIYTHLVLSLIHI